MSNESGTDSLPLRRLDDALTACHEEILDLARRLERLEAAAGPQPASGDPVARVLIEERRDP